MNTIKIGRALLSVSDKSGLVELGQALDAYGVELVSTGGTAKALREAGLTVRDISELTGFPEMMDGRVKTLHPVVHGGLLAVRDNAEHVAAMQAHAIGAIDLVVVNLYPFEATVARGAGRDETIENIDIGGPSMVRSAAKNHAFVTIVTDPVDYATLIDELAQTGGQPRCRSAASLPPRPMPPRRHMMPRLPDGLRASIRASISPPRWHRRTIWSRPCDIAKIRIRVQHFMCRAAPM